jgi:hypothetical protein
MRGEKCQIFVDRVFEPFRAHAGVPKAIVSQDGLLPVHKRYSRRWREKQLRESRAIVFEQRPPVFVFDCGVGYSIDESCRLSVLRRAEG